MQKHIDNYAYNTTEVVCTGLHSKLFVARNTVQPRRQKLAIKVIESAHLPRQHLRNQFLARLRSVSEIEHPNVLLLQKSMQSINNVYLVTEFCEDGTLEQLVAKGKPSTKEALRLFHQVLAGVLRLSQSQLKPKSISPRKVLVHKQTCKVTTCYSVTQLLSTACEQLPRQLGLTLAFLLTGAKQNREKVQALLESDQFGAEAGRILAKCFEPGCTLQSLQNCQERPSAAQLITDRPIGLVKIQAEKKAQIRRINSYDLKSKEGGILAHQADTIQQLAQTRRLCARHKDENLNQLASPLLAKLAIMRANLAEEIVRSMTAQELMRYEADVSHFTKLKLEVRGFQPLADTSNQVVNLMLTKEADPLLEADLRTALRVLFEEAIGIADSQTKEQLNKTLQLLKMLPSK